MYQTVCSTSIFRRITLANCLRFATIIAALCPLLSAATETNYDAPVYNNVSACAQGLAQPPFTTASLESENFTVVSWNIEKGKNPGWKDSLRRLAEPAEFVLIQEATFTDTMKEPKKSQFYWSFTPGYKTKKYRSGVLALSRNQPNLVCSLRVKEPWLSTPKSITVLRYNRGENKPALMVVNVHSVNFSVGVKAYKAQLEQVNKLLALHSGPVILAGDFNTWSKARMAVLDSIGDKNSMQAVEFQDDNRTKKFDHALDHMFVRGLRVKESTTEVVKTSDHNPISAKLEFIH